MICVMSMMFMVVIIRVMLICFLMFMLVLFCYGSSNDTLDHTVWGGGGGGDMAPGPQTDHTIWDGGLGYSPRAADRPYHGGRGVHQQGAALDHAEAAVSR